jgi:hypothetical protein
MKLDWITDPHLDHLPDAAALIKFVDVLHARPSDGLLITGDIAESSTLHDFLGIVSGAYQKPIFFVLGNHDYYGAWMDQTHERARLLCSMVPDGILNWMPEAGPVELEKGVFITGVDGLYDGKEGAGSGTDLGMTDFYPHHGIMDLAQQLALGTHFLFEKLDELAHSSTSLLEQQLETAVARRARRVLILTHVPPFLGASRFRGRPSDPRSAPFYVNKTMGNMLLHFCGRHPGVEFELFAGHTHGKCVYQAATNLVVRVGGARYSRQPQFQEQVVL